MSPLLIRTLSFLVLIPFGISVAIKKPAMVQSSSGNPPLYALKNIEVGDKNYTMGIICNLTPTSPKANDILWGGKTVISSAQMCPFKNQYNKSDPCLTLMQYGTSDISLCDATNEVPCPVVGTAAILIADSCSDSNGKAGGYVFVEGDSGNFKVVAME